jgi:hypothetical protein
MAAFDSPKVTAGRIEVHLRRDPKVDALDLVVFADTLSLPQQKTIDYAKVDARITTAQFLKGMLSGNADWRTALEAWRGGEGRIELVDVQSKPDSAKGRMVLDGTHALDGTFTRPMFGLTKLESAPLY